MDNPTPANLLPTIEGDVLKFWRDKDIFKRVIDERKNSQPFVFYDGPPFANGTPHYGHITQMAVKDAVLRYKTMLGFNVPRKIGWDTHGLPVEYQLEKELNLSGKKSIQEYGVDKFVEAARSSVLRYSGEWVATMERMGRWMDLKNPYTTMDNSYIESVWWAFSELHKKGLIYEDYRVGPYCPRCGTVLSNFEVNQGYKDNTPDVSVYVALEVVTDGLFKGVNLVFWTTTPWTIPAVMAMSVNPELNYVIADFEGQRYAVAEALLDDVFEGAVVVSRHKGQELVGLEYKSLYQVDSKQLANQRVVFGEHVTNENGTGIASIAPAYGEIDSAVGKREGLPMVTIVLPDGTIEGGKSIPGEGQFVKKADRSVIDDLQNRGLLVKEKSIKHTYPFCWRCDTPLLYYPTTSWYVAVTKIKDELVSENKTIKWQPEHIRDGRFGKWLEGARDWAISRDRFWGAPIPVWKCSNGHVKVVSSAADIGIPDLHRPYIDDVTFDCSDCGGVMHREPFVFDCWFESGSMPFAQFGYPHKNQEMFNTETELNYPADFIVEALDQTRGWFYTLHVLGVALFGKSAFKAVDVNGLILAPDGKKLSKKLRNYTEPEVLFENEGVDAFRLFVLTATAIGEDYRFSDDAVRDVRRRWITPLLNVVSYFELSKQVVDDVETPEYYAKLDEWIKARVAEARAEVFSAMEADDRHAPYDLVRACRTFGPLIEDLSTWYVRLCRGRTDVAFTDTLQQVLIKISTTYAPFLPFVTEHIYQKIGRVEGFPESVHLCLFKSLDEWENAELLTDMAIIRNVVTLGREQRALHKINNRQPLWELTVNRMLDAWAQDLIGLELNVKKVTLNQFKQELPLETILVTDLTPELQAEGEANELRRTIQDMRKQAGLTANEQAVVSVEGLSPDVERALASQLKTTRLAGTIPNPVLAQQTVGSWHIRLGRL